MVRNTRSIAEGHKDPNCNSSESVKFHLCNSSSHTYATNHRLSRLHSFWRVVSCHGGLDLRGPSRAPRAPIDLRKEVENNRPPRVRRLDVQMGQALYVCDRGFGLVAQQMLERRDDSSRFPESWQAATAACILWFGLTMDQHFLTTAKFHKHDKA